MLCYLLIFLYILSKDAQLLWGKDPWKCSRLNWTGLGLVEGVPSHGGGLELGKLKDEFKGPYQPKPF